MSCQKKEDPHLHLKENCFICSCHGFSKRLLSGKKTNITGKTGCFQAIRQDTESYAKSNDQKQIRQDQKLKTSLFENLFYGFKKKHFKWRRITITEPTGFSRDIRLDTELFVKNRSYFYTLNPKRIPIISQHFFNIIFRIKKI